MGNLLPLNRVISNISYGLEAMYVRVYVYCVCMYAYNTCTYIHIHMHVHVHVRKYICIYIHRWRPSSIDSFGRDFALPVGARRAKQGSGSYQPGALDLRTST